MCTYECVCDISGNYHRLDGIEWCDGRDRLHLLSVGKPRWCYWWSRTKLSTQENGAGTIICIYICINVKLPHENATSTGLMSKPLTDVLWKNILVSLSPNFLLRNKPGEEQWIIMEGQERNNKWMDGNYSLTHPNQFAVLIFCFLLVFFCLLLVSQAVREHNTPPFLFSRKGGVRRRWGMFSTRMTLAKVWWFEASSNINNNWEINKL